MAAVKGALVCSHHDEARKGVSVTAHGVAYMRGQETQLYNDPFATLLGGTIGQSWAEHEVLRKFGALNASNEQDLYSHIIVRTKQIDDRLLLLFRTQPQLAQVCVLGAGLDTRPWRLSSPDMKNKMDYFEVDFQEIFDYKLGVLAQANVLDQCHLNYHPVAADLSLATWPSVLLAAGYNPQKPTVWLVEGVTGYLSEEENRSLFSCLATLSAPGSHLMATFITPAASKTVGVALHRFMPENPLQLLQESGNWTGEAVDLQDAAEALGRAPHDENKGYKGYLLACVSV